LGVALEAELADRDRALQRRLGNRAPFLAPKGHAPAAQQRGDAPAHSAASPAASRSRSARLFFCAAVLSWPQAASMSRPRGVRTGALMPASNTMSEKRRIRSGSEHSYAAPGQGLKGMRLTLAGSLY